MTASENQPQKSDGLMSLLFRPGERLSRRFIHGGMWSGVFQVIQAGLGTARILILAYLLTRRDLGLFGIALISIGALEHLSQSGFSMALIQKKDNITPYLNTAWTVQVLRGIMVGLVVFLAAPFIAAFFNEPEVTEILRLLSITPVVQGFNNIGVIYFEKEIEYHKHYLFRISGNFIELLVGVGLALRTANVWALVWGLVAAHTCRLIVSYLIHPYRPRFQFDRQRFRELFDFGKWVFLSYILIFILFCGDDMGVGKLVGVAALGLYQVMYRISYEVGSAFGYLVAHLAFPSFSKLQQDIPKLKVALLKTMRLVSLVALPSSALLIVLADLFMHLCFKAEWWDGAPTLMILTAMACLRTLCGPLGSLANALARPDIPTRAAGIQVLIMVIAIYPVATVYGIEGVAALMLIQLAMAIPYLLFRTMPLADLTVIDLIATVMPQLLATTGAAGAIYLAKSHIPATFLGLAGAVIAGLTLYAAILAVAIRAGWIKALWIDIRDMKQVITKTHM